MDIETLSRQNPWWTDPEGLRADPTLAELKIEAIRWTPRLLYRFRFDRDRVYTLRGPRQVGKTTLVKIIIQNLVEAQKVDPRSVFYFSCDLIRDARELDKLVETYMRWQEPFRIPRRFVFLDEISSVDDWAVGIRALSNRGRLRQCTLLLTSSHALDVAEQVERLPGRRGEKSGTDEGDTLDKVLLPMKFVEYAEILKPAIRRSIEKSNLLRPQVRSQALEAVFGGRSQEAWSAAQIGLQATRPLLRSYLVTGGFARPLNEFHQTGGISRETYDLYTRALVGDLARWNLSERTARELLAGIIEKLGSPVSWRGLAEETDIASHLTVAKYVEALERTFAVQTVYQYDRRRLRPAPKKDRKLYFSDPFLFHAVRTWALGLGRPFEEALAYVENPEHRGFLLEGVIADHLARLAFAIQPTDLFAAYEHVMFWRSKRGWEVDFVLSTGKKPRAIQVTVTRPHAETRRALRAFGGGIVLTETGEGDSVPIPSFLLLV